ncbi:hypothetical protein V497_01362 [Pseudogymnoascus sp. VKM F-4516 (FW-969)]|nr:hypothetical protein V497_01362 [Pseudogymnoascus sp. VKM F-4516 (FW-969)]
MRRGEMAGWEEVQAVVSMRPGRGEARSILGSAGKAGTDNEPWHPGRATPNPWQVAVPNTTLQSTSPPKSRTLACAQHSYSTSAQPAIHSQPVAHANATPLLRLNNLTTMAPRRNRLLFVLVLAAVVGILYITSSSRAVASHDFYTRTRTRLESDGLDKIEPQRKSGGDEDDKVAEAMSRRLMDAEVAAKEMANKKAPTRESVMGEEETAGDRDKGKISAKEKAEGQQKVVAPKEIVKDAGAGKGKDRNVAGRKKYPIPDVEEGKPEKPDESDEAVTAEMNSILKMSPIIIFSKSYCGFSRKAKSILLTKYTITPTPYVVELDKHPLGPALQARLATMTGRKTVPNVLVKGKSIGGGDDIVALDEMKKLEEKVMGLGGKGVSVSLREVEGEV